MLVKQENVAPNSERGQTLIAAGGLIGALAASSCCIVPSCCLALASAAHGSATFAACSLSTLLAVTLVFVATGYWLVHRAAKRACDDGEACARPLPSRLVKTVLVLATILVTVAIVFDFLAPLILSS